MALIRPRLNDYYELPFVQEEVDFAIPFLDEDVPLYLDPFLMWKSPSQQDNALHAQIAQFFNNLNYLVAKNRQTEALEILIKSSECKEVGLGQSKTKAGLKIGPKTANQILGLFQNVSQIRQSGFVHFEEIQLYVDGISKDRVSDISSNFIKSFLIDYTMQQCERWKIPLERCNLEVYSSKSHKYVQENGLFLPRNPETNEPILLVPKRWLRYTPWINYDDYYAKCFAQPDEEQSKWSRVEVLEYNRRNYDMVQSYVKQKEKEQKDCFNDPLFKQIPITSAQKKMYSIIALQSGNQNNNDKKYEELIVQLMASLLYPHLDFAADQVRNDSGTQIRDLIFYNNRSHDFLRDIYDDYGCRQIVMELKNVLEVERDHINQLNRYLSNQFGCFGIIITRNPLKRNILKNTIDLWAGQRRCIIILTDEDIKMMVDIFETKQRLPIEVIKKKYIEFVRSCPS